MKYSPTYWFGLFEWMIPRGLKIPNYRPHVAWVYVMTAGDAVKVGISTNPETRLRHLQTGQDRPVRLIWLKQFLMDEAQALEQAVHAKLQQTTGHARGEWYYLSSEAIVAAIENEIKDAGYWPREDV